jgi:hypothetical protein
MKFDKIEVYGAAGGNDHKGIITARFEVNEIDTIHEAKYLLSAAPELLDALMSAEIIIEDEIGGRDGMSAEYHYPQLTIIRAAIKKAKGE